MPDGVWPELVDLFLPHGNDLLPDTFRAQLKALRESPVLLNRPRPICCNEDSIDLRNIEAALDAGCSWGHYDQGFGCDQKQGKMDWTLKPRGRNSLLISAASKQCQ
jgi:hypothetical protein